MGYALIPAAAMIASGSIAAFRPPGARLRSGLLHFAAGVVFAVVAVELLPDVVHEHAAIETVVGFAGGTAAMLGLRWLTRRSEPSETRGDPEGETTRLPGGLLAASGVDIFIDGLMVGIGFVAGAKVGIFLTIALTFELISLGFATSATLGKRQIAPGRNIAIVCGLAALVILGALAGGVPLRDLSGRALASVLSFGSAALLFLVTEELLKEAHREKETPLLTAMFFAGFLLLLLLEMFS